MCVSVYTVWACRVAAPCSLSCESASACVMRQACVSASPLSPRGCSTSRSTPGGVRPCAAREQRHAKVERENGDRHIVGIEKGKPNKKMISESVRVKRTQITLLDTGVAHGVGPRGILVDVPLGSQPKPPAHARPCMCDVRWTHVHEARLTRSIPERLSPTYLCPGVPRKWAACGCISSFRRRRRRSRRR